MIVSKHALTDHSVTDGRESYDYKSYNLHFLRKIIFDNRISAKSSIFLALFLATKAMLGLGQYHRGSKFNSSEYAPYKPLPLK